MYGKPLFIFLICELFCIRVGFFFEIPMCFLDCWGHPDIVNFLFLARNSSYFLPCIFLFAVLWDCHDCKHALRPWGSLIITELDNTLGLLWKYHNNAKCLALTTLIFLSLWNFNFFLVRSNFWNVFICIYLCVSSFKCSTIVF